MTEQLQTELEGAIGAIDNSFHVRLIATFGDQLLYAPADADAARWLREYGTDFDQFPVRQGSETIGILLRFGEQRGKTVQEWMQPLREGLLVSANMPITELIPQLRDSSYRLVLRGSTIDGLVTQSDLLKLPVRLVTFALITHLEQVMADLIRAGWPDDTWLPELTKGRRDKINGKFAELRRGLVNPPLVELTEFSDKRDLCKKLFQGNKSKFKRELSDLQALRDQVVHAATFVNPADGPRAVTRFVRLFENAGHWIRELTELSDTVGSHR